MSENESAAPAIQQGPRRGESPALGRFDDDSTSTATAFPWSAVLSPSQPALWGAIAVACDVAAVALTIGGR